MSSAKHRLQHLRPQKMSVCPRDAAPHLRNLQLCSNAHVKKNTKTLMPKEPRHLVWKLQSEARIHALFGGFIMKEELTAADYLYSVKIGSVIGFLAGWAIGIALLLYLDSRGTQ